ncbi:MAG: hypothetical protein IJU03_01140 [Thermoguttaceae bacterium]|nr:hypothetical protein [Thermoguttaceae bacterium]
MKLKTRTKFTQKELEELGLAGVDTTRSKAPKYRQNRRKKEALDVLRKTLGDVTTACDRIGISRQTFYQWRRHDPEFDAMVSDINERALDFVESQMFKGIKEGNARLIMFYLMNRGKSRGYCQKTEEVARGSAVNVVISADEAEF